MKKKMIIFMLMITIVSMTMTAFAVSFSDLAEEHWAHNYITTLVDEGVINGYPDGTYKPENSVTRAEFLKLIMTALHGAETFQHAGFEGIHWALPHAIEANAEGYLVDASIIKLDNIDKPISRLEMVQILSRICTKNSIGDSTSTAIEFSDIYTLNSNDVKDINTVSSIGLINGYPNGTFRPQNTMTRAECATIIYRFIDTL